MLSPYDKIILSHSFGRGTNRMSAGSSSRSLRLACPELRNSLMHKLCLTHNTKVWESPWKLFQCRLSVIGMDWVLCHLCTLSAVLLNISNSVKPQKVENNVKWWKYSIYSVFVSRCNWRLKFVSLSKLEFLAQLHLLPKVHGKTIVKGWNSSNAHSI